MSARLSHESSRLSPTTMNPPSVWVKADFHLHSSEDPIDSLDYSAIDLLERAAACGFATLAITLHSRVLDDPHVFRRAQELGILLIPGCELRIEGRDVVALNVTQDDVDSVRSFDDLRALRARRGHTMFT